MTDPKRLIEKITSRGYWRVVIRPTEFSAERVKDIAALGPLVAANVVSLRGWNFPHVARTGSSIGPDFIENQSEWNGYLEVWRFFQSGQFYVLRGMRSDWMLEDHGKLLWTVHALYTFTEIFEFAARLATTAAGGERRDRTTTVVPPRLAGNSPGGDDAGARRGGWG